MDAAVLSRLPADKIPLILAAMEQKALFLRIGEDLYAAAPTTAPAPHQEAWWIYRLEEGAPEYFLTPASCSCEAFRRTGSMCKHMKAIKYGSDWRR